MATTKKDLELVGWKDNFVKTTLVFLGRLQDYKTCPSSRQAMIHFINQLPLVIYTKIHLILLFISKKLTVVIEFSSQG